MDVHQLINYKILEELKRNEIFLVASPHASLLPLQTDRDQKPLETIERFLLQSSLSTYWLDPSTLDRPSQWLTLLENIDILVGMRFHALLMALKAGKPVIGIAYDQKVNQLLKHFEQPVLSLDTNEGQCHTIWPKIIENALYFINKNLNN